MKNVFKIVGACVKLVLLVALLICCIYLVKIGFEFASSTNDTPTTSEQPSLVETDLTVTFDEIYKAYKSNELRADESYKNNRYRITAKINGMNTGGLLNATGGATLTMEIRVDNTIVFFYAEFEKDQEEALKKVSVGDTIVLEGTCLDYNTWKDCVIIE